MSTAPHLQVVPDDLTAPRSHRILDLAGRVTRWLTTTPRWVADTARAALHAVWDAFRNPSMLRSLIGRSYAAARGVGLAPTLAAVVALPPVTRLLGSAGRHAGQLARRGWAHLRALMVRVPWGANLIHGIAQLGLLAEPATSRARDMRGSVHAAARSTGAGRHLRAAAFTWFAQRLAAALRVPVLVVLLPLLLGLATSTPALPAPARGTTPAGAGTRRIAAEPATTTTCTPVPTPLTVFGSPAHSAGNRATRRATQAGRDARS